MPQMSCQNPNHLLSTTHRPCGSHLTTWVFEGFVPTAKLVNGKAYSIISDHLGTPILAVDSEGNEVWNRQLDIYGRVRREYKHSSLGDEVFPFVPFLYQGSITTLRLILLITVLGIIRLKRGRI